MTDKIIDLYPDDDAILIRCYTDKDNLTYFEELRVIIDEDCIVTCISKDDGYKKLRQ